MTERIAPPVMMTGRFELRCLAPDDATPRYLHWLANKDARRYILSARETPTLDSLRGFIASKHNSPDVLFLGIFERVSGTHIGNIKYEPIDDSAGTAEMGILIGDPFWRGRGVAREVIIASARWLYENRRIRRILLGVEEDNAGAISAYRRAGFHPIGETRDPRAAGKILRMSLEIEKVLA